MKDSVIRLMILAFFVWAIVLLYDNFLTTSMVRGTYVNTNFKYHPFLIEIPYRPDTLILADNGKFTSKYWGNGNYQIKHKFVYTQISLNYDVAGKGSITFNMNRYHFQLPQIVLFNVENHAYRKIN
jgi:hypothetical protein